MCGKDFYKHFGFLIHEGSPPHVRERLILGRLEGTGNGITPACAGKTGQSLRSRRSGRDHPRMCGKDYQLPKALFTNPGSPPHVRERLVYPRRRRPCPGITPACAGKTKLWLTVTPHLQDHPRMCGKDFAPIYDVHGRLGSPPHVRERLHR